MVYLVVISIIFEDSFNIFKETLKLNETVKARHDYWDTSGSGQSSSLLIINLVIVKQFPVST
jgi:hypothetical protein